MKKLDIAEPAPPWWTSAILELSDSLVHYLAVLASNMTDAK
jgi:hypothetical protein